MWDLFLVFIGMLIGWNMPQPEWAKRLWERFVGWFS